ncbi:MAG: hypothetical protein PHO79_10355 [Desulfoplanes sp.]|nr:hypothetical protein [Desulfoplanes sp.]
MNNINTDWKSHVVIFEKGCGTCNSIKKIKKRIISNMKDMPLDCFDGDDDYQRQCELLSNTIRIDSFCSDDISELMNVKLIKTDMYFLVGDITSNLFIHFRRVILDTLQDMYDEFSMPIVICICPNKHMTYPLKSYEICIELDDKNFDVEVATVLYYLMGIWYMPLLMSIDPGDLLECFGGKRTKCALFESETIQKMKRFRESIPLEAPDILKSTDIFSICAFSDPQDVTIDNLSELVQNLEDNSLESMFFCDFGFTGACLDTKNRVIVLYA